MSTTSSRKLTRRRSPRGIANEDHYSRPTDSRSDRKEYVAPTEQQPNASNGHRGQAGPTWQLHSAHLRNDPRDLRGLADDGQDRGKKAQCSHGEDSTDSEGQGQNTLRDGSCPSAEAPCIAAGRLRAPRGYLSLPRQAELMGHKYLAR